jgi:N-acetylmuramoyl-L-alanine amidase
MAEHVVRQGECLSSIAAQYGFSDPGVVYKHSANADLRQRRPDMNVLYPGDVVVIPDKDKKTVSCATLKKHKFQVKLATKKLVIKLVDGEHKPMDGLPYVLLVAGKKIEGETDGDGKIEHDVPADATQGMLSLCGNAPTPVYIGSLNPSKDTGDGGATGLQSRLRNLGYDPGPSDGQPGPRTLAALREFQTDHGLEPTGELDDDTLAKLHKVHGV